MPEPIASRVSSLVLQKPMPTFLGRDNISMLGTLKIGPVLSGPCSDLDKRRSGSWGVGVAALERRNWCS